METNVAVNQVHSSLIYIPQTNWVHFMFMYAAAGDLSGSTITGLRRLWDFWLAWL